MYSFLFQDTSRFFLQQTKEGVWLPPDGCQYTVLSDCEVFHLKTEEGEECVAAYVQEESFPGLKLWDLREAYSVMPRRLHILAGKAAELLYWDAHSRYCSKCGAPMERYTEISKVCTACGEEVWPQLQTAAIVLIEHDGKVLLVRARNFRKPFHGLVAGFVETGESLEECVRREVREETGLEIQNLRYFASQPWPYPIGLMVGFRADYESGTLRLQEEELIHADWYTADNLPEIPSLPSLARKLIDVWVEEQEEKGNVS